MLLYVVRVSTLPGKSWISIAKISRTWKMLEILIILIIHTFLYRRKVVTSEAVENEFGSGRSWKLKFKVLKSPGIYLWLKLTSMPSMCRTPCVNNCMKYSCYVLTK